MSDVHLRRIDVVLCWKVDRFGRSLKHLVNALADLDSYGVAFGREPLQAGTLAS
jgi:DNA invertase Pin-like site-specific DNA recombinase